MTFNTLHFLIYIFKKLKRERDRKPKNMRVSYSKVLRGCLVCVFKQPFSVFKQYFMHFYTLFHLHVFPQIFSNNNFQFLNTCTKRAIILPRPFFVSFFNFFKTFFFFVCMLKYLVFSKKINVNIIFLLFKMFTSIY